MGGNRIDAIWAKAVGGEQPAQRVIELSTAMLAVLFGVTALLAGVVAVQPRPYSRSHAGLDRLRPELEKIVAHKRWWYCAGIWLFFGDRWRLPR